MWPHLAYLLGRKSARPKKAEYAILLFEVFGGGIWTPPAPHLNRIRDFIADNARSWARISNAKKIRDVGGIKGDGLKRPPKGFDAEHVHIEDLKRKSFFVMTEAQAAAALSPDFVDDVSEAFGRAAPLNRFIADALDLPF